MAARDGAVNARRASLCQLRDLIITAPEPLRSELRPLTRGRLLKRLAAVRPARHASVELCGTLLALSSLARRIEQLTAEERDLETEIATLARDLAPQLLNEPGVGPLAAGQLLLSWSHPAASVAKLPSRASPAAYRSLPRQARRSVTGSTAAATASSTARCTESQSRRAASTRLRAPTWSANRTRARADARRSAASNANSPAPSTPP